MKFELSTVGWHGSSIKFELSTIRWHGSPIKFELFSIVPPVSKVRINKLYLFQQCIVNGCRSLSKGQLKNYETKINQGDN